MVEEGKREPLPCPHCGSAKVSVEGSSRDEREGYGYIVTVSCGECGASIVTRNRSDKNGWNDEPNASVTGRAIEAWNRRAPAALNKEPSHG